MPPRRTVPQDLWLCTTNNAQGCSLLLSDVPEVAWIPYVPTSPLYSGFASGWGAPQSDVFYDTAVTNAGGSLVREWEETHSPRCP